LSYFLLLQNFVLELQLKPSETENVNFEL